MKLLVTTSQSLLLVDTARGSHEALDRGRGLYYGIAEADGKLFVASRRSPVSTDEERESERGTILIFDRELRPQGQLRAPFPLRDLHEIAWHQGKLYASCSHDNMVAIYDGSQWEQWFPLGGNLDDGKGPGDINHFNSFHFDDERIWVLAHNRGASELLAFSLTTRELVERVALGNCAHNIWRENGQLHTCSSKEGKLAGTDGFVLETGGFPRGIVFAEGLRCVGISATAERMERDYTTGKLAIYDQAWHLQQEIVLQDEGLILDVRLLPAGFATTAPRQEDATEHAADEAAEIAAAASFYRAYEDRNRGSRDLIKSRLAFYHPFLEPWVTREPAPQALDLGCGRGEWLEVLRDAGYDASGVDLDDSMLAGLRRWQLKVRHADALQALRETPSNSMAVVSAFHLVEHIPFEDVRLLIREAMRVLKPGGLLILETPNPENLVVGSSSFYQDPTHIRPLPPELLRFAVEFEGFARHIVARLQEDPSLRAGREIGMWHVLDGASPDYAVIGQKPALQADDARFLRVFNSVFDSGYGITVPALAHRYETQERRRAENMFVSNEVLARYDTRIEQHFRDVQYNLEKLTHELAHQRDKAEHDREQAEERVGHLQDRIGHLQQRLDWHESQLHEIFDSLPWRMTKPLRWTHLQLRLLRQMGLRTRLRMALAKVARFTVRKSLGLVDNRPGLRRACISVLKMLGLHSLLRPSYVSLSRVPAAEPLKTLNPATTEMSERSAEIYQGLQAAASREDV